MADYLHFSLRFNYDKPEHRKIIDALENLDRTQYSSKTHFIICALEHYTDWISLDDETKWALEREKRGRRDVVTKEELDSTLARLKAEVYEKILQCISSSGLSVKKDSSAVEVQPLLQNDEDDAMTDNLAGDLSQYAGIMDSVMSWSEE
jgi:hypothetical protein